MRANLTGKVADDAEGATDVTQARSPSRPTAHRMSPLWR